MSKLTKLRLNLYHLCREYCRLYPGHGVYMQRGRLTRTDHFVAGLVKRPVEMSVAIFERRRTLGPDRITGVADCVVAGRRSLTRHFQSDRVVIRQRISAHVHSRRPHAEYA